MNTQILKKLLFIIVLIFCPTIKASLIETLPSEIVLNVLKYIEFFPDDYIPKLEIATVLNKDNFFGKSPQEVLHLLGTETPNLLLTCKSFYRYCSTDSQIALPHECESYIDFLIQHQETFDLQIAEKKRALHNFAFIFFNLYQGTFQDKDSWPFQENKPPFWELFVFSLTCRFYKPYDYLTPNKNTPKELTSYFQHEPLDIKFFKNIKWFDEKISDLSITIERKIIIMHLFHLLNIRIYKTNQSISMLELFLATPDLQQNFIDLLKRKEWNTESKKMWLTQANYSNIKSAKNMLKIINFLLQYKDIHCPFYNYNKLLNESSNEFKNVLILDDFVKAHYQNQTCSNCLENKSSIIQQSFEKIFHDNENFWGYLLKAKIESQKQCLHTRFDNKKTVDFMKKYHPHFDGINLQKIIFLLQKQLPIRSKYGHHYTKLFDRNSNSFKNMLNLTDHYEKPHLQKRMNEFLQNKALLRAVLEEAYFNENSFYTTVMKQFSCHCWKCNKERFWFLIELSKGFATGILLGIILLEFLNKRFNYF